MAEKINIYYSDQDTRELSSNFSIFLAGPTPRSPDVKSWRPEAIECFRDLNTNVNLIVPEPEHGVWKHRNDQIDWEQHYLNDVDVVMFWVPRDMKTMPALTTNIEFGMYMDSERMVFGAPVDADNNWYMEYCCEKRGILVSRTLQSTCSEAIGFLNRMCEKS